MILYHVTRREDAVMIQSGLPGRRHAHGMGVGSPTAPWRSRTADRLQAMGAARSRRQCVQQSAPP